MADLELATLLSKRCRIIDEYEEQSATEVDAARSKERSEMAGGVKEVLQEITRSSNKPSLPPKPKIDILQKSTNNTKSKFIETPTPSEIPFGGKCPGKKPEPPIKPPRLSAKFSEDNPSMKIAHKPKPVGNGSMVSTPLTKTAQKTLTPQRISDERDDEGEWTPVFRVWNPYTECKEFSRKEVQRYMKEFQKYDRNSDKFLDFDELKYMMEKIGHPQTHLALKSMIREVDEDKDNKICFKEFMLIFRKAKNNELSEESGLFELYKHLSEIDVDKEGVSGAKNFFETKIQNLVHSNEFEEEIKQEKLEKKVAEEERKRKKTEFNKTVKMFQNI